MNLAFKPKLHFVTALPILPHVSPVNVEAIARSRDRMTKAASSAPATMLNIAASKLPVTATIEPGISEPPTPPNKTESPLYSPVAAPTRANASNEWIMRYE